METLLNLSMEKQKESSNNQNIQKQNQNEQLANQKFSQNELQNILNLTTGKDMLADLDEESREQLKNCNIEDLGLLMTKDGSQVDVKEIDEEEGISAIAMKTTGFKSDKERRKFIKAVEKLVRNSLEMKRWTHFVRANLNLTACPFTLEDLKELNDDSKKFIHLHHHPFTLEDIIDTIIETYLAKGNPFTSFEIAQEVLKLHYELKVGIVPLTSHLHEKYHKGDFLIPIEFVVGNWQALLEEYIPPQDVLDRVYQKSQITVDVVRDTFEINEINRKRYFGLFELEDNPVYRNIQKQNELIHSGELKLGDRLNARESQQEGAPDILDGVATTGENSNTEQLKRDVEEQLKDLDNFL